MDPIPVHSTEIPAPVTPTTAPPLLDAYKNPFKQDVLDSAIREVGDVTQKRRNALGTEAFGAGAFGDARHGIESSQLTEDAMKTIGDLTGQFNAQGFESAMNWLNTDLDRQTSTAFGNANLDNQWLQNQLGLMNFGSNLDQLGLSNGMSFADALLGLDQYDRDYLQQDQNVAYEDFLASQGWDNSRVSDFLSILTGQPTGTATTSTSPNNSWASLMGASLSGIKDSSGNRLFGG